MNIEDERIVWIGALRYYIGKDCDLIRGFCSVLVAEWDRLSSMLRDYIIDYIEDEYYLDDLERKRDSSRMFYKLGTTEDREEWDRVRKLWTR